MQLTFIRLAQKPEEMFQDLLNGEKELGEEEYDSMMKEWM